MAEDAEEWFEAIDCDDEEFVKSLAAKTPSLLERFYEGAEYPEELKELAEELLGKTIGPLTALEFACFVESEDTALVLVDLIDEQHLSHKWGAGNTIFHLAAFNGLERVLRKLLRREIPFTNKNKAGFRPVDCVANDATRDVFANFRNEEHLEAPIPLNERKKMVDKTDLPKISDSREDMSSADDGSEYEIPEYPPLRKIDPKAVPKKSAIKSPHKKSNKIRFDDETTYFDACRNGELDLVKEFVQKKKLSPKAKTFLGITVLHMAAESGNLDLVKFLVEHGADVKAVDADGWSPFHLASSCDSVPIVKYLIEKGADINLATKDGEYAIEFTESEELKKLLQSTKGFDKAILDIVANRPKEDDEEQSPASKKSRRKGGD